MKGTGYFDEHSDLKTTVVDQGAVSGFEEAMTVDLHDFAAGSLQLVLDIALGSQGHMAVVGPEDAGIVQEGQRAAVPD